MAFTCFLQCSADSLGLAGRSSRRAERYHMESVPGGRVFLGAAAFLSVVFLPVPGDRADGEKSCSKSRHRIRPVAMNERRHRLNGWDMRTSPAPAFTTDAR